MWSTKPSKPTKARGGLPERATNAAWSLLAADCAVAARSMGVLPVLAG
ncbi:MAG TPA: hypothetical protein VD971_03030 [Phycisphaerales bacterium]|nr:hypothetical protein [Phycisphaerales bacterium]